jgi:PAS domain S-box-containing protein
MPRAAEARESGLGGAAGLPMLWADRFIGVIEVLAPRRRARNDHALALLASVASQLAQFLALTEAETRFQAVVRLAANTMMLADGAGNIISWSAGAERIFGHSEREALGQPLVTLVPERERAAQAEALERLRAGGAAQGAEVIEFTGLRRNGEEFAGEAGITSWQQGNQTISAVIVRDVSERRRAEEALRASEGRYRIVVSAMAEGVLLVARDGTVAACNESAERILGRPASAILGRPAVDSGWRPVRADGTALPLEEHPLALTLATGDVRPDVEMGIRRPDGALRWLSVSSRPLRRDGERALYAALATFADVTDRKLADEEIRRQRDYAAALVDAMVDGLTLLSPAAEVLEVSSSFCRMTGFERADLVGARPPYPYWPEADPERLERGFQRIEAHGAAEWDLRFRRADGSEFPVIVNGSVLRGADGGVLGYLATVKDVTERKHDEERLRRSEAEQAALRRVATSVATDPDPSSTFALVAAEVAALLGVEAGMVARFEGGEAVPVGWWGAHQREIRVTFPLEGSGALAQVHRTGRPARVEDYAALGDDKVGRVARASAYRCGVAAPIRVGGAAWGAILAATTGAEPMAAEAEPRLVQFADLVGVAIASADAREALAHASRRMELILGAAGEAVCGIDMEGRATFANPAAARITGYGLDEMLGRSMHDLIHHTTSDGAPYPWEQCPVRAALTSDADHGLAETLYFRRDGSSFPAEATTTRIEEDGRTTGAVVVFRDISDRRAVERMKDEFTSVVSHELRTPLTSIRGSLGLLAGGVLGPLPDRAQHMVDIAVANTDRLVRLINDILDIERMESGKAVMERQRCDLAELVEQAVEVMRALADQAGVTLETAPAPAPLWADPDRILQTITNLLSNAIKFSQPGGVVRVTSEWIGDEALMSVSDGGRGIPSDKLESVFGRFQQVDASDARQKGGTGLGLAICRGIVEQHGGRIWVESEFGVGSTFRVSLPTLAHDHAAATVTEGDGPLVVVCDDDAESLRAVAAILAERGYRVIGVRTGEEAIARAVAERPSAVILDLLMPGMNGWETAAALKERPETRDIPIVIMSALSPAETDVSGAEVVDWVTKPMEPAALFRGVERALDARVGARRVLLVEDDPDLAEILTEMLGGRNLEVHHARTAREAIRLSEALPPDLLVLDLGLPDVDGLAVVEWLRRHGHLNRIPIAVYTARDLSDVERERLRQGQAEVLIKGQVSPEALVDRAIALIRRVAEARARGVDHAA